MPDDGSATFQGAVAGVYDRFIGRYGPSLASAHIAAAGVHAGQRALDVGCGPGPLTSALAEMLGPANVTAVDPSEAFADECRRRVPGANVLVTTAESLPDFDRLFDVVLSQLVVNFMNDAPVGVARMRAATCAGGTVASCAWDYGEGMTLLRAFWDAAHELDAGAPDEGRLMRYATPEELAELWRGCGLHDVETHALTATAAYESFDDLWQPFTAGIGPAGAYCASLDDAGRERLRTALQLRLGTRDGPFELSARAWFVRGTA